MQEQKNNKESSIKLSASKLDKFNSCSWQYAMQYVLKFKSPSNSGNVRGNACHLTFEFLLKDRRRPLVAKILEAKTITVHPPLERYIRRLLKEGNLEEYDHKGEHNFDLTDKMICTGLSLDFYCDGAELMAPELSFDYQGDGYSIRGYIDKPAKYPDREVFADYKSDAQKWAGSKLEFNIQSLIYSLWSYRERGIIPYVKFIFLRLKKHPYVEKYYTKEQLEGFEDYLRYITSYLENFDFNKATSNLAADKGYVKGGGFEGLTMCGKSKYEGETKEDGSLVYSCSYKWGFKYYAVYDKEGNYLRATKDINDITDDELFLIKFYRGCPRFNAEKYLDEQSIEN